MKSSVTEARNLRKDGCLTWFKVSNIIFVGIAEVKVMNFYDQSQKISFVFQAEMKNNISFHFFVDVITEFFILSACLRPIGRHDLDFFPPKSNRAKMKEKQK